MKKAKEGTKKFRLKHTYNHLEYYIIRGGL